MESLKGFFSAGGGYSEVLQNGLLVQLAAATGFHPLRFAQQQAQRVEPGIRVPAFQQDAYAFSKAVEPVTACWRAPVVPRSAAVTSPISFSSPPACSTVKSHTAAAACS